MFNPTRPTHASTEFDSTDMLSTRAGAAEVDPAASTLSPSLLQDLKRYAEDPVGGDLLPVVAASVRHGKALSAVLESRDRRLSLTLHPRRQVYYCEIDLCALPDESLSRIRLLQVEPDADVGALLDGSRHIGSLRPLLWHLALRGGFAEALPELEDPVRCRVTLGAPLNGLPIDGATRRLIQRMKVAPLSIDELLPTTVLTRPKIQRVWNALYLQSALMVSRGFAQ